MAVVVIGVVGGSASNDDKPKKEKGNSINSSSITTTDEKFGINETAVFNTIKISADELKESGGSDFFEPENGKVFVGVKFTVENTSSEDKTISSLLLFDAYCDGTKCDYSLSANAAFDEGTLDGTLAPGKKMSGYYAVEVPTGWTEIELQVKSNWLSDTKAAFVFNK